MSNDFVTRNLAARAFFQALRREWAGKNPNLPCPVPPWDEIEADAKHRFAKCMGFALAAAEPGNLHRPGN